MTLSYSCGLTEHTHDKNECYKTIYEDDSSQLPLTDVNPEGSDNLSDKEQDEAMVNEEDRPEVIPVSKRILRCTQAEHHHGPQCSKSPEEIQEELDESIPPKNEGSTLSERIIQVAQSQLEYSPDYGNYLKRYDENHPENPITTYWNRYGALVGDAYNQQYQPSSTFVNFVLHYSDETLPWNLDLTDWQRLEGANAEENSEVARWQASWRAIDSIDQAKPGSVVLFTEDETSSMNIDSNLQAGIIIPEDIFINESEATAESTIKPTETDSGEPLAIGYSENSESEMINGFTVISVWKDQKPEAKVISTESIVRIYESKNGETELNHDNSGEKNEELVSNDPHLNNPVSNGENSNNSNSGELADGSQFKEPIEDNSNGIPLEGDLSKDLSGSANQETEESPSSNKLETQVPNESGNQTEVTANSTGEVTAETGSNGYPSKDQPSLSTNQTKLPLASTGLPNIVNSSNSKDLTENITGSPNIIKDLQSEEARDGISTLDEAATEAQKTIKVKYSINLPNGKTAKAKPGTGDHIYGLTYEEPQAPSSVEVAKSSSYKLLPPTSIEYRTKYNNDDYPNRAIVYYFEGWKVNGTGDAYLPGDKIAWNNLVGSNENIEEVELVGSWKIMPGQGYGTAIFSVNYKMTTETDYGTGNAAASNVGWLDGIYSTAVLCDDFDAQSGPASFTPSGPHSSAFIAHQNISSIGNYTTDEDTRTLDQTDLKIRSLADTGIDSTGVTKSFIKTNQSEHSYGYSADRPEYNIRLVSFPDDKTILDQLYEYQYNKELNNKTDNKIKDIYDRAIPSTDLNTDKYQIKWFVFKYTGDGFWHIDGKLVPKTSYINITKHFYGDETAIDYIKRNARNNNYYIEVIDNNNNSYKKTLLLPTANNSSTDPSTLAPEKSANVYAKVDGNGNDLTYSWRVPTYPGTIYTFKENNYDYKKKYDANHRNPDESEIVTIAQYNIINSSSDVAISSYPDNGVNATAVSYSKFVKPESYQTVNFYNSYYKTSTLVLQKIDAGSSSINTMGGVKFTLKKENEHKAIYYQISGNILNLYPGAVNGTIPLVNNQFTTVSGQQIIFNSLQDSKFEGSYILEETESPEGYTKIPKLKITFDVNGLVTSIREETNNDNGESTYSGNIDNNENLSLSQKDGVSFLQIKNRPKTVNFTVEKKWEDDSTKHKSVEVELYRDDGVLVGQRLILSANNGWKSNWDQLPILRNGQPITYKVKEMSIDGIPRDDTSGPVGDIEYDGFRDYEVTYQPKEVTVNSDTSNNQTFNFIIRNAKDSGEVTLEKVDSNDTSKLLTGAKFEVYQVDPSTLVKKDETKQIVISENGKIVIPNLKVGIYCLEEIEAPLEYQCSDQEYYLIVDYIRNDNHIYHLAKVAKDDSGNIIRDDSGQIVFDEVSKQIGNSLKTLTPIANKVNQSGKKLDGVKFKLYRYPNANFEEANAQQILNKESDVFISLNGGKIPLPNLEVGFYKLQETKTLDGYNLPDEDLKFEIRVTEEKPNGYIHRISPNNDTYYEVNELENIITVKNLTGQKLPETGGVGTNYYTSGGILLIAASCLLYTFSKKQPYRKGEQ